MNEMQPEDYIRYRLERADQTLKEVELAISVVIVPV